MMAEDIVRRKAANIVYDNAVKTEPEPEEEASDVEAPAGETADAE